MRYRIGPEALAADMIRKMQEMGLEVVNPHAMWYPNGFEPTEMGIDRVYNHDVPKLGEARLIELPVFYVAHVRFYMRSTPYVAATGGNYWASGVLVHVDDEQPANHRPMKAGEGLCALSLYPPLRSILCGTGWPYGPSEVYIGTAGKVAVQSDMYALGRYRGFVPNDVRGDSYPIFLPR